MLSKSIDAPGLQMRLFQSIPKSDIEALLALLARHEFEKRRDALLAGGVVNATENRPAWHTALRQPEPPQVVARCLASMAELSQRIRGGDWPAQITDVVNIGIGGSDLGPNFVYQALSYHADGPRCHYVSNLDESQLKQILKRLKQETTLFIVVSKTFTTWETLENARKALDWLKEKVVDVEPHLIAVTAAVERAQEFGVNEAHILPMWDWVGGRYSLWSAVGFSLVLALGMDCFQQLLAGAHAMDQHFARESLLANLPVVHGMLSVWFNNTLGAGSYAVVPYAHGLRELPNYLQQLFMESLGKRVTAAGEPVSAETGAVIWGGVGTNSQHAFHQMLMQGTRVLPLDFILPLENPAVSLENHLDMSANCLAQTKALRHGRAAKNSYQDVVGAHPLNLILLQSVNEFSLGALLAFYEHSVFVQSICWDIDAFDQWGVELGKNIAKELRPSLKSSTDILNEVAKI